MKTRVLLVDDHHIVLEGLRQLLETQEDIEVVGTADNGLRALELVRDLTPDIVVMDVTMPGLNGVEVTRHIHEQYAGVKVLALSMHAEREIAVSMARAGASGFVLKSAPIGDLLTCIRAVATGGHCFGADVATGADPDNATPPAMPLSDREREVLQLLAEGKTSQRIAQLLYVSARTVDWHRRSIMQKLGLRSVAELTKYAIRQGLTPLDP